MFGFEKKFISLCTEALKEWQPGILVLSAAFGAFVFLYNVIY